MALIYFYDATDLDVEQLSNGLRQTDHHWEFVEESISVNNLHPDTEVISMFVTSEITAEIIERLPKLKLIACRSTGFNNIDLAAAKAHGVSIVNVPTYGEQTVAEYAFTLLLALARKLPKAIDSFDTSVEIDELCGFDLDGKTLGVIGTGHIGRHSIKIAKGFGMHVLGYDPYPNEQAAIELGFEYVDLNDLLGRSDVVTLHAPYFPENHHLINEERLMLMKRSAVLINTARGELVDTQALTAQLSEGRIAGAALDVIEGEHLLHLDEEVALLRSNKLSPDLLQHSMEIMALHKMPNVILTPHNAFNTIEAIGRINSVTADNIIRFWYGDVPNLIKEPKKQAGKLVIVRHTESEWNAEGRWTGQTNINLSDKGFHEAALLGQEIEKARITFQKAYCSEQIRTMETMQGILDATGQFDVPFERVAAINERDYGDYTGKNKWEVKEMVGEEQFQRLRRGWNEPVPNGETLKKVYERAVPFYLDEVLPQLRDGKNILLVSHGNSIRAIMKYIESISDEAVENLEMVFGSVLVYEVDDEGKLKNKTVLEIDSPKPNA